MENNIFSLYFLQACQMIWPFIGNNTLGCSEKFVVDCDLGCLKCEFVLLVYKNSDMKKKVLTCTQYTYKKRVENDIIFFFWNFPQTEYFFYEWRLKGVSFLFQTDSNVVGITKRVLRKATLLTKRHQKHCSKREAPSFQKTCSFLLWLWVTR